MGGSGGVDMVHVSMDMHALDIIVTTYHLKLTNSAGIMVSIDTKKPLAPSGGHWGGGGQEEVFVPLPTFAPT